MITGLNTDVEYKGLSFHIQTEDKGLKNPVIETLLYKGGMIVVTRRYPYTHLIGKPDFEMKLKALMWKQHESMKRDLLRGLFDRLIPEISGKPVNLQEDIDQLVMETLEELKRINLFIEEIRADEKVELKVSVKERREHSPVKEATVNLYLKKPKEKRFLLSQRKTDDKGESFFSLPAPEIPRPYLLVLVAEKPGLGKDEKWIQIE